MTLDEIIIVTDQSESLLASYISHIRNEKEIGKSENFIMYEGDLDGKTVYVSRLADGTFIGYIIGENVSLLNKSFFQSQYTYVDKQFKKKGYASAMYMYIVRTLRMPIVSDETQTKYAKALWQSFINKNMCKAYDSSTDKFVSVDEIDADELYAGITQGDIGKRYHLIIEEQNSIKFKSPNKIIYERVQYTAINGGFE